MNHSGADPVSSRAAGLARNLGLVLERTGLLGLAELLADRTMPNALSYRRTFVVRAHCAGEPHPELAPTRLCSLKPALIALFAELARTREPEIQHMSEGELAERFACGDELWLFHADGAIGHLRWVTRRPLALTSFTLPLGRDERLGVDTITLPAARRRSLARMASSHVRHVLGSEGVISLYGLVNSSNRRWRAGMQRMGYSPVATVHLVSLAGRQFVRVVPASAAEAELLEQRGIRGGRWLRARSGAAG